MKAPHVPGRLRAAPSLLAVLLAVPLMLAGCDKAQDRTDDAPGNASAQQPPQPSEPIELSPLNRGDILTAAARAADMFGAGQPLPEANRALIDRKFALRLPFGCAGAEAEAWAGWTWNPATKALKVTIRPEQWGDAPWIAAIAPERTFEAVEGFWLRRPWTSAETCPSPSVRTPNMTGGGEGRQTVGLAQFFSASSPRTLRRGGRPYAVTLKEPVMPDPRTGRFALSIRGRISGFADGQPIRCWTSSPDLEPVCLVAVELESVGIEDLSTGKSVAEWHS